MNLPIVRDFSGPLLMLVYRVVFIPIAALVVMMLLPFHEKLRRTLGLRMRPRNWPDWVGTVPTLWVHCASGEFEYARPVLREWRQRHPNWKIYVTYFSPSFRKVIENHPDVDASGALPLDLPGPTQSFLRKLKPRALAVARTDLWPELAYACRKARVPVVLFSTTQAPFKPWQKLLKGIFRWRLEGADYILAVSSADKTEIDKLHLRRPVEVLGDTRYDQVLHRLQHPKEIKLIRPSTASPTILISGSTWPQDEHVLVNACTELITSGKLAWILVPHEPTPSHLLNIAARLRVAGLTSMRYSEIQEWNLTDVLVVDKTGILAELYTSADLAFVGGSFDRQVHSVMEPLAAGLVTFIGPRHRNNREAVEFQGEFLADGVAMVNAVHDSNDLKHALMRCLIHPDRTKWRSLIRGAVMKRSGATARVAARLDEITV
jgi:3-deoxy-D-manno-octulosonic-acid transferase